MYSDMPPNTRLSVQIGSTKPWQPEFVQAADDSAVPKSILKKRKREAKPLRSQLILDEMRAAVKPVCTHPAKKQKGPLKVPGSVSNVAAVAATSRQKRLRSRRQGLPVGDIWDAPPDNDEVKDWITPVSATDLLEVDQVNANSNAGSSKIPAAGAVAAAHQAKPSHSKRKAANKTTLPPIPAVEIDMAGCSYNPDHEMHQDALAVAVAAELSKELRKELRPAAPSQFAPEGYVPGDELDGLVVDEEQDDDDDGKQDNKQDGVDGAQEQQQPKVGARNVRKGL